MKVLMFLVIVGLLGIDPPGKIGKVNSAKAKAKEAFMAGDYKTALDKYRYITDSLGIKEDEVVMNMAHAYFNLDDTTNAISSYQRLLTSQNKTLKSNAYQQLGVLNNRQGKLEEALANFKEALKTDPTNDDARYDYEMVKKKLEEKKKQEEQQKQDQNKDQENKDNKDQKQNKDKKQQEKQNKEQQDKEQQQKDQAQKDKEEKEKKEKEAKEDKEKQEQKEKKDNFNPDKLKDMKVTEEKAKMILEAMKNQEVQYLQQNKRKATKPKDKGKPDW
jgi:Ca-activated chloride channel homolog